MPELPEVETVRLGLAPHIEGRRLTRLEVLDERLVARSPLPVDTLVGSEVLALGRRGKWLFAKMRHGPHLVLHLRMSGRLLLDDGGDDPRRAVLEFEGGARVDFVDRRRFGELLAWTDTDLELLDDRLGPEADTIRVAELRKRLAGRRGMLKAALCNQHVVAGIGNMYADEALWRAGLAWDRPAGSLGPDESRRLASAIRHVMGRALDAGGTSTRDGLYVNASGDPGWFAVRLAVYQREDEPCPRCGAPVRRAKTGASSAYFCASCQT